MEVAMQLDNLTEVVLSIRQKLASRPIHIRWPTSESLTAASLRKSKRRGAGIQFFGHKLYDAADGDDPRRIDHNATASEPEDETGDQNFIIQTFKSPRIVRMHVLLDVNKSMNLGTQGTFKSLLGAVCAGCGIQSARKTNDLASFVSYTHHPLTVLKAQNAGRLLTKALVHAVEDMDLTAAPERSLMEKLRGDDEVVPDAVGGGLAASLSLVLKKTRNVVLLVSDFVNMNDDDWEALRICGVRNDTIAVFVQDKRERELPTVPWPGMHYTVQDFQGHTHSFWIAPDNTSNRFLSLLRRVFGSVTTAAEYRQNFARHEAAILEKLQERGVNTIVVSTDEEETAVPQLLSLLTNKLRS
jgi:uncharacterized protein (DUF58 family)